MKYQKIDYIDPERAQRVVVTTQPGKRAERGVRARWRGDGEYSNTIENFIVADCIAFLQGLSQY